MKFGAFSLQLIEMKKRTVQSGVTQTIQPFSMIHFGANDLRFCLVKLLQLQWATKLRPAKLQLN